VNSVARCAEEKEWAKTFGADVPARRLAAVALHFGVSKMVIRFAPQYSAEERLSRPICIAFGVRIRCKLVYETATACESSREENPCQVIRLRLT
jgi:hypothetical protein